MKRAEDIIAEALKSDKTFKREVLNKEIHVLVVSRKSILKQMVIQVQALVSGDFIDNKKNSLVIKKATKILFNLLNISLKLSGVEELNPSINTAHTKLLRSIGVALASKGQIRAYIIPLNGIPKLRAIFAEANSKLNSLFNTFSEKPIPLSEQFDVGMLFSSTDAFKIAWNTANTKLKKNMADVFNAPASTKRSKAIQSIKRAQTLIRTATLSSAKKLSSTYESNQWVSSVKTKFSIKDTSLKSVSVIVVEPKFDTINNKGIQVAQRTLNRILKKKLQSIADSILSTRNSPSILDQFEKHLANTVAAKLNAKTQPRDIKGRFIKVADVLKSIVKVKPLKVRTSRYSPKLSTKKIGEEVLDLLRIKNIVNIFLAETVKNNMGKGSSSRILNYRTGRLARSMRLDKIAEQGGILRGRVDYQRNPYDIYGIGGTRRDPPSRDPKKLLDKSIRQILKNKLQLAISFTSELI